MGFREVQVQTMLRITPDFMRQMSVSAYSTVKLKSSHLQKVSGRSRGCCARAVEVVCVIHIVEWEMTCFVGSFYVFCTVRL